MTKTLNKDDMLVLIRKEIKREYGTSRSAAPFFDVTPQRMSQILGGKEPDISPKLLKFVGYEKLEPRYAKEVKHDGHK